MIRRASTAAAGPASQSTTASSPPVGVERSWARPVHSAASRLSPRSEGACRQPRLRRSFRPGGRDAAARRARRRRPSARGTPSAFESPTLPARTDPRPRAGDCDSRDGCVDSVRGGPDIAQAAAKPTCETWVPRRNPATSSAAVGLAARAPAKCRHPGNCSSETSPHGRASYAATKFLRLQARPLTQPALAHHTPVTHVSVRMLHHRPRHDRSQAFSTYVRPARTPRARGHWSATQPCPRCSAPPHLRARRTGGSQPAPSRAWPPRYAWKYHQFDFALRRSFSFANGSARSRSWQRRRRRTSGKHTLIAPRSLRASSDPLRGPADV